MGIVGFSAQKSRTTSAVLGPTPGSCRRVFLASSKDMDSIRVKSPLNSSTIIFETRFIVLALRLYKPATFKHSSILLFSAFANVSGVIRNCFEIFLNALVVFLSVVFCEIIVAISVLNEFLFEVIHLPNVKVFRRVFRIFSAQLSVICHSVLENDK